MFRLPSRLIDTQIAAALLGKTPQIGLQDLVGEELSIRLDKGFTRTNWAARPLPGGALQYALDDVRHLFALWGILREKLNWLNRLDWLEEDCRTALETPVLTPPIALWSRLKRVRALDAKSRCAALALVEWRERCAQRLNRPRRWLCSGRTAGAHRQSHAAPALTTCRASRGCQESSRGDSATRSCRRLPHRRPQETCTWSTRNGRRSRKANSSDCATGRGSEPGN